MFIIPSLGRWWGQSGGPPSTPLPGAGPPGDAHGRTAHAHGPTAHAFPSGDGYATWPRSDNVTHCCLSSAASSNTNSGLVSPSHVNVCLSFCAGRGPGVLGVGVES